MNWFYFRKYNGPAIYGFGTDKEAHRYVEILQSQDYSQDNDVNVFCFQELDNEDAERLNLDDRDDCINLDDELINLEDELSEIENQE